MGVDTDKGVAEDWFLKSAQTGFAPAQHEMSLLLQAKGEEHLAEAIDWLRRSALQGFPLAQYQCSLYCEGGIGMASDPSEAFRFCLLAANRGYYPAARRVASMLEKGIGVAINLEQAFHWYYRAAELGDVDSATSVGRMYAGGVGVEKSDARALEVDLGRMIEILKRGDDGFADDDAYDSADDLDHSYSHELPVLFSILESADPQDHPIVRHFALKAALSRSMSLERNRHDKS